ncbi:unnamed protein product [Rotaria socialis]|uniref:Uncharacterized protein n=2 Tax=Rotaria socialis TaxID=392032 RepID=A0A817SCP9_9BILA|nr:unnamed protein product [Rotaria socialis]
MFTVDYEITPLSILVIDKYRKESKGFESMFELQIKQLNFSLDESSTIQLCILFINNHNDHQHLLCRQIHVGINSVHSFWNLSLKLFYMCLICLISAYYILYGVINKRYQNENKLELKIA